MIASIGIILALLFLVFSIYYGLNIAVSAIVTCFIIILTNALPITDSFTTGFTMLGAILGSVAPLFLFGGILGVLFQESGAADSLASACIKPFKAIKNEEIKLCCTLFMFIVARIIFGLAGIDSGALMVVFIGIAVSICAEFNLNVKYAVVLSIVCGQAANMIPGTPNTVNIMCEKFISGFDNRSAMGFRLLLLIAFVVFSTLILWRFILNDRRRGITYTPPNGTMKFEVHDSNRKYPNWVLCLVPIAVCFLTYNLFSLDAWISLMLGCITAFIVLGPYIPKKESSGYIHSFLEIMNRGAYVVPLMVLMIIVPTTIMSSAPGFTNITNALGASNLPVAVVLLILALIILGFGGMAGFASIGAIAPAMFFSSGLTGMGVGIICIAAMSVFDALPNNMGIGICNSMVGSNMKESYPGIGVTSVLLTLVLAIIATICVMVGIV